LVYPGSPFGHFSQIHQTQVRTISTVKSWEIRRQEVPMRDGEPGWFYVGNGQLRYKDSDGWTDQYQDIDGPAKTSDVGPSASPDVLGSGIAEAGRGARDPSSLTRFCSSAAHYLIVGFSHLMVVLWRLIVGLRGLMVVLWRRLIAGLSRLMVVLWRLIAERYRQASASYASRSVAGRLRGPSRSSVLVGRLMGLMKRSWLAHPRREIVRHWSSFRLDPEEGEECPQFVLDPVRLQDLIGGVVGVDQRDPHPVKVMGAQPPMDG
jgi:hypothetical protein